MLRICLTFDYELFFGENYYGDDEVLFLPTKELIDGINKKGISATFFVDVCSIVQHKKYNLKEYVENFSQQLRYMIENNQDVQLHIHSHWLNSTYSYGYWTFDEKHYRIHSYGFDDSSKPNVNDIVAEGINYLNETLLPLYPDYKCIAYRAGGFCFQPHEKLIKILYENGIRIDSSITPNLVFKSENNWYDFSNEVPNTNWYISANYGWWKEATNKKISLYEVPIATEKKEPISFCLKRIFSPDSIKFDLGKRRGSYIACASKSTFIARLKSIYNYIMNYGTISMDGYEAKFIYTQIYKFYKKHCCDKNDYTIALIGHPKLSSKSYVENVKKLIDLINNSNEMDIEIISIRDEYERISNLI